MYASSRNGNPGLRFGTKIAVMSAHAMKVIATISSTVFPSPVMAATGIARTLPRCLTRRSGDRQTRQM
jgi:hypothetical protein